MNRVAVEAEVQHAVAAWRGLRTGSVVAGRQLLREVLEAPLTFERDGKVYRFSGPVAVGLLIAGAVGVGQDNGASPTGSDTNGDGRRHRAGSLIRWGSRLRCFSPPDSTSA